MVSAQDPIFSQFHATPMQINPAFAGNTLAPRVALAYRDQWHNFNNAFSTAGITYDQFLPFINSGVGISLLSDRAGDNIYQKNALGLNYAYRLEVTNDMFIKIGVEAGATQSTIDWDRLIFLDQLDPVGGIVNGTQEVRPTNLSKTYFDISSGMLLYSPDFYVGFSLKHLNTPDESYFNSNSNLNTGLPIRYAVQAGTQIPLDGRNKRKSTTFISPNILFVKQGPFAQVNVGANVGFGSIFAGAWYRNTFRNSDAIIAQVGFQKGIFKVGYSHDITINGLPNTWGAHELTMVFNFDALYDRSKPDYNDCFKIFR
jgi:type IX secretion system PorP/SprF family membrane protein